MEIEKYIKHLQYGVGKVTVVHPDGKKQTFENDTGVFIEFVPSYKKKKKRFWVV